MDLDRTGIDHREYEELLAPAALGALTPEEHELLAAHLRTCASCRETFGRLLATADTIALTVPPQEPPLALRGRLQEQIERSPRAVQWAEGAPAPPASTEVSWQAPPAPVPIQRGEERQAEANRGRSGVLWALAIAAALLIGLAGGVAIDWLVLEEDSEPVREIALQSPGGIALDDVRLEYYEDAGVVRLTAEGLPDPPDGQIYQVWLIEGDDAPPTPVGTIDTADDAFATSADLERYSLLAVTLEPGPLGSEGPTSDPIIVAELPDPSAI